MATVEGERPETTLSYSPAGTLASTTRTSSTGEPSVTRFASNAHGEQVLAEEPRSVDGVVAATTGTFDAFGQSTSMRRRLGAERWLETAMGYDAAGNLTSISQPSGEGEQLTSTSAYDALGRLVASTDPQNPGHEVEFSYDGEGAQVQRVDKANGAVVRRTETTPNPDDTLASVVASDYDPATGAPSSTLATCNFAAGADPTSGHDADGQVLETRTLTTEGPGSCDAGTLQHRQSFSYDQRGWVTASTQAVRSPETGTMVERSQAFAHDADGARASATHGGPTGRARASPSSPRLSGSVVSLS